ncbi:non-ribosomal peptide synthetase, partial [Dyella tabacisoli]
YMQQALESLLQALETDPRKPVRELEVLPADERELLLHGMSGAPASYDAELCMHQLFEAQVRKSPAATALVSATQSLSYAELNAQANRLAHHLIALGIRPDDRVAICAERSVAMVVGLLAILKAGGAYLPLDPTYPGERLTQIIGDAEPALLLADPAGRRALDLMANDLNASARPTVLDIAAPQAAWSQQPATDPDPRTLGLNSAHVAYVIYTSGSTGQPKGVQNEHRALINRLSWMQDTYGLSSDDVVLQKTPYGFDVSVWEFFWTLGYGATLLLAAPEAHKDPDYLVELIARHGVTTLHFAPSMLSSFLDASDVERCTSLRRLICSGEALPAATVRKARQLLPSTSLHNLYGPTEAAIDVTAWSCPADFDANIVPIGRPIANTSIYLLDEHQQPVPLGAVGELYIGGDGVARGYLKRAQLTAERFLHNPFGKAPDARMYRSGDLARYLPDGDIEYLGRNDHQVKIRGFRIELGEIEAALNDLASVAQSTVIAREDRPGERRLVAYVTLPADVGTEPAKLITTWRTQLLKRLPDYMVPSAIVVLEALPLTPNGKVDRNALPAPEGDAYARRSYEPPQGEVEVLLAQVWSELLGIERISRHDNFFELGGHSLLAIRVMGHLRRLGLHIEVHMLFATPILAELAALTAGESSHRELIVPANLITVDSKAITPEMLPLIELQQVDIDHIVAQVPGGIANVQDIYALSPLQDGILFHHQLASEGDPYLQVNQLAFAHRGVLDSYLAALQQVVDRHDILRTSFAWEQLSTPAQVVWRHARLDVLEVTLDTDGTPPGEQLTRRFDPRHYRIDLTHAPLLRLVIAREPDSERWLLLQLQHHLIDDISSLSIMLSEIQAIVQGRGQQLPPPQSFRNVVAQSRLGISAQEHERFFRGMLADINEPTIPFGLGDVHRDGSRMHDAHRVLPPTINDRLRTQARNLGVSLASLCHLAWGQVVARTSGREHVVFGTVLFGRMQAGNDADRTMGLFINTLPLRLDLDATGVEDSVR